MLTITVPAAEFFDEAESKFITSEEVSLSLEHSLVSLSAWESKWKKSFLSGKEKSTEETLDYIRCMCLTPDVPPETFSRLTQGNFEVINAYLTSQMTATTFAEMPGQPKNRDVVTSELVYYWMIALQIPVDCETWHFNRLLALIRVVNIKNSPPKKVGRNAMAAQRTAMNEARMKEYGTTG